MRTKKVNVKRAMDLMEERFAEYKTKQSEERWREDYENYFDFILKAYIA